MRNYLKDGPSLKNELQISGFLGFSRLSGSFSMENERNNHPQKNPKI
ncbi:hypothetical protein JET18_14025 [Chryseobacterium sp. L7]|uniref:Uncharacterized protein n=1 Tax=Chryseobacterium endalhagicum TaxID=2797638 RepID=A0ABS1QI57_9FLAO|nr:hypothetical protein [Chryseobacterium endalhagicum]MBL1221967.1 hypothetical protein [Chryseobacterium endalhagicum]